MIGRLKAVSKQFLNNIDWKLLLFLLLFLNVKLVIKIIAIVIIYILRPDFKFGFKRKGSSLPTFYLLIIGIAFFDFLVFKGFTNTKYIIVFVAGTGFWLLSILAVHQLRVAVSTKSIHVIHNTIFLFFACNAIVSIIDILLIMADAGAINPYRYQGMYQKYFIGTGDLIRGITFDTSTTNAVINAAGVIYFLCRKQATMTLVCMATLLLTGSNFTNLILTAILAYLFIAKSDRIQKSLIVICVMFLVVFMVKVSPQNDAYAMRIIDKIISKKDTEHASAALTNTVLATPDSLLSPEEKKRQFAKAYLDSISLLLSQERKITLAALQANVLPATVATNTNGRPVIPQPSIHTKPFQRKRDTLEEQKVLLNYVKANKEDSIIVTKYPDKLPGKLISFLQTATFLQHHPSKIITGAGMGNFSSKLAFRTTALNIGGGYPAKYAYINNDFRDNHLATYLNFFSKDAELHSVVNTPNSVYNQLLGEYGLAGIAVFVTGYLFFWIKHYKKLSFGIPILLLLCSVFFVDYWFEQLSVVIVFELLLFLDIKEAGLLTAKNDTWKA